jgi:putative ABC transport system ATP-binding protein
VALSAAALRGENLYRFYHAGDEETLALRGVSLTVAGGEMVAVTGPSGSGKSTLIACLSGMDDPDGGTVYVAGQRISRRPEHERAALRARAVGVLFQNNNLINSLTVRENVLLAQALAREHRAGSADALLDDLGISSRRDALPAQLSGGELVRAGLATALANNPAVLLADEPTGEVDTATEKRVLEMLQQRVHDGLAMVVVTHSDAVAAAAGRVVRLADGQVVA